MSPVLVSPLSLETLLKSQDLQALIQSKQIEIEGEAEKASIAQKRKRVLEKECKTLVEQLLNAQRAELEAAQATAAKRKKAEKQADDVPAAE